MIAIGNAAEVQEELSGSGSFAHPDASRKLIGKGD
jgi:hypothetical protein